MKDRDPIYPFTTKGVAITVGFIIVFWSIVIILVILYG